MSLVAVIARKPPLSLEEWLECIERVDGLAKAQPKQGINPFTQLPTTFHPPPGKVEIAFNGEVVGGIEVSSEFDEDGELDVFSMDSKREGLRRMISLVAERLRATVEWLDEE
jgi:hypothetical protein